MSETCSTRPITRTEQKALEWASRRMKPGYWVDECYYVRSGQAIWFHGDHANACTCIEVPKSYVPFLPHQPKDGGHATTGGHNAD